MNTRTIAMPLIVVACLLNCYGCERDHRRGDGTTLVTSNEKYKMLAGPHDIQAIKSSESFSLHGGGTFFLGCGSISIEGKTIDVVKFYILDPWNENPSVKSVRLIVFPLDRTEFILDPMAMPPTATIEMSRVFFRCLNERDECDTYLCPSHLREMLGSTSSQYINSHAHRITIRIKPEFMPSSFDISL